VAADPRESAARWLSRFGWIATPLSFLSIALWFVLCFKSILPWLHRVWGDRALLGSWMTTILFSLAAMTIVAAAPVFWIAVGALVRRLLSPRPPAPDDWKRCKSCRYPLEGLEPGWDHCPECGTMNFVHRVRRRRKRHHRKR
jgi:predicted RNA-binding Zn-ribbon protein involved in translation (DUF1610 family)